MDGHCFSKVTKNGRNLGETTLQRIFFANFVLLHLVPPFGKSYGIMANLGRIDGSVCFFGAEMAAILCKIGPRSIFSTSAGGVP